jgi:2-amino-4-hydroxy-6-hydroxymethyldihydropteridine diphosphokinase
MAHAYIGIGSNLGDPVVQVRRGIEKLRSFGQVLAVSSLYRSLPWGPVQDQPDFVNAVILIETLRGPRELLAALKAAEEELGREPGARWGPRAIDFDILTYDDIDFDDGTLRIPHPQLRGRAFVLVPLAEIASEYAPLLAGLSSEELTRVRRL